MIMQVPHWCILLYLSRAVMRPGVPLSITKTAPIGPFQIGIFTRDPSFDPAVVARSSQSAAVLSKWVIAMDDYQRVKKVRAIQKASANSCE
jgi:hypothetical protein